MENKILRNVLEKLDSKELSLTKEADGNYYFNFKFSNEQLASIQIAVRYYLKYAKPNESINTIIEEFE